MKKCGLLCKCVGCVHGEVWCSEDTVYNYRYAFTQFDDILDTIEYNLYNCVVPVLTCKRWWSMYPKHLISEYCVYFIVSKSFLPG